MRHNVGCGDSQCVKLVTLDCNQIYDEEIFGSELSKKVSELSYKSFFLKLLSKNVSVINKTKILKIIFVKLFGTSNEILKLNFYFIEINFILKLSITRFSQKNIS